VRIDPSQPGFLVSGAAHGLLLLAALVAFSSTPKFEDAQETVPVQVITNQQFNQIAKGEKTAEKVLPKPARRVDKLADAPKPMPRPPILEAKTDVPTPPPPPRRVVDPGQDQRPPAPAQKVAALPPPRPVEKPQPPVPLPPLRPPPKIEPPRPLAKAIDAPLPPQRPKMLAAVKDQPKPLPPERPKLLEQKKLDQLIKSTDASKPRANDQRSDAKDQMDPAAIARLLSHDAPRQRASTGRHLDQVASLGSPTADAPHMSPSMSAALDGLLIDQYRRCWTYLGLDSQHQYFPEISVEYRVDGELAVRPALINPPSDPNLRSLAESALRAVRRCNPLRIPAQYAPYFNQWKSRIVRFDPAEMAG